MPNISVVSKSMKVVLNTRVITLSDIYNALNCFKSTNCPGPAESSPNIFFTNCKFVLSIPLLWVLIQHVTHVWSFPR